MDRALIFSLLAVLVLFAVDYYVYRNWRRFAGQTRWRWTIWPYRVLLVLMPFAHLVYFGVSNWWTVEPKLLRSVLIGFWFVYYVPKFLLVLALAVKDFARFVYWLFSWFQHALGSSQAEPPVPKPVTPTAKALDLTDMKRLKRREFIEQMGWSAASVPFVMVGYGVFRTLYDFEVHRITVPIANLPPQLDGLTIAQLSDLHAGSFFSERPMQEAADLVNSLRPDVIAVTGDYVNRDDAEMPVMMAGLNQLRSELATVGVLGNHDHYARVERVIGRVREQSPIDLLVNQHRTLRIDGAHLHLIGTDNTGFRQHYADLPGALRNLDVHPQGDEAKILLAHDPTFWDQHVRNSQPDIDLMLAGHTHGGQIGVEVGPVRWGLARVAYERWAGLYTEERSDGSAHHLYVNRGLGTVGPPLRVGIRPEVTLLTLRRA
ncbi:MAG: metallophosphoesterase [Rhodothermales bacterium]